MWLLKNILIVKIERKKNDLFFLQHTVKYINKYINNRHKDKYKIILFQEEGIEFVKHFRCHLSPISHVATNSTGTLLCTASQEKTIKVFDVVNFGKVIYWYQQYQDS